MDRFRCQEASSFVISGTILDQASTPVPLASISAATLTLYDIDTYDASGSPIDGIINSRNAQDIRNAHDVEIHATSGLFTWTMEPDDNPIITSRRQVERHRALFTFTWTGGSFNYECEIEVVNRRTVS